jgi:TonB-dependent starch-binding outer membrane protein SusC
MERCLQKGMQPPLRMLHPKNLQRLIFLFLSVLLTQVVFAQDKTVTGRVASRDTSLAGVTVSVKGTTQSTQTDENGRFSINAPANGTLVFSYVGYGVQEVRVGSGSTLNVQLLPQSSQNG